MTETSNERFLDNILTQMCKRLIDEGVPVARTTLHVRTLNPQWMGARMLWRRGLDAAELSMFGYGIEDTSQFQNSPIAELYRGASEVRQSLEAIAADGSDYPLYKELKAEGYTDYVAWSIEHTLGKRHVVTFATDVPGGFDDSQLAYLRDLLPALALVSEIRVKNRLARTLLETYVGPYASELILAGSTTRGSGTTVGAAILICDLRDFTAISDAWPRDDVIDLLNDYFDAMCGPIEKHGGEILKFMGDGLLAIFPLSNPNAGLDLLAALGEAQAAMRELNDKNVQAGQKPLGYGIGVHVGDVMYGNIGSKARLDFTVIGPAVNVASRIESLTKLVNRKVLVSRAFADLAGSTAGLYSLGVYPVKGLTEPIEVLALQAEA
ncbi:MAG: adenylate/guanylate cyclase domain-containing protein [Hyphomicrobiales bacterium]|nr:adenylate/guanylate cyclase domain-containing protein [Hyphomicrobiales bacterium]